jgi:hypothetical protein
MSDTVITTETTALELGQENMDAIVEMVIDVLDGWYEGKQIDWEDVLDRIDGNELPDGATLDIRATYCPAWKTLKRHVHKM